MSKLKDLSGQRFGRLTAVELTGKDERGKAKWRCVCDCGKEIVARSDHLTGGNTKSCGCFQKEFVTIHGKRCSRIYNVWAKMKQRCDDPLHESFENYGARGIGYDPSWGVFKNFLKDMQDGYSDDLTLDRFDNNRGYSKENCRWATRSMQNRNRRKRVDSKNYFVGTYELPSGKFSAKITVNRKAAYLGTFSTALEAAIAYDNAVEKLACGRPNGTTKTAVPT